MFTAPSSGLNRVDKYRLLALHRRNNVSNLLDEVKKPSRGVPRNAPPEWQHLSLDRLIPMFEFPPNAHLNFSRQKIGRELFAQRGTDFDLSDPNCQTVTFEYEPLHDHNLTKFFRQPRYLRRFRQCGLITCPENEVICTLRQFNAYRRYLKRLHTQQVNRVRDARDQDAVDARNYQNAQIATRRYAALCERHAKVAEKRAKHAQAVRDEVAGRKERHRELVANFEKAIERFCELQAQKQLDCHEKSQRKEYEAAQRRHQLQVLEKRRIILMHRKFALESGLVRQRLRLQRIQRRRKRADEIRDRWDTRTRFNAEKRARDEHLLALNEEMQTYAMMERSRHIAELYERDLQEVTKRRAALIVSRYPGRDCESLVRALQLEIRLLVRREQKELEEKAKSSVSMTLTKTPSSETEARPASTAASSGPSSGPSATRSKTDSKKTIMSPAASTGMVSHRVSNKPLTLPYEPQHLSAVGLVDSVQGYGKLVDADIRAAVESTYRTKVALRENINSNNVLNDADEVLLRISKGYTTDIPRDGAVIECVVRIVAEMLQRVQTKPLVWVENTLSAFEQELQEAAEASKAKFSSCSKEGEQPKPKQSILKRRERHPCEMQLKFGQTFTVNTSAYADDIEFVKPLAGRPKTPNTPVRELVRYVLAGDAEMEPADINGAPAQPIQRISDPIPAYMQTRAVAHLYDFQKRMILDNLSRFEETLGEKIEQKLLMRFNFTTLAVLKPVKDDGSTGLPAEQMSELIDETTDSVLTLPEKDDRFGERVMLASRLLTKQIMLQLQRISAEEAERLAGCGKGCEE